MSVSDQIKAFTEDIEASYGTRMAEVADIVKETHQTLGKFNRERTKMASDLKRSLASNRREHERMAKDLKRNLASNRSARTSQVRKMRAENNKDLKENAQKIAKFLSASEKERGKEFAALMGEIKGAVAVIEKDTAQTLADFRSDQKEMAGSLRSELSTFRMNLSEAVDDMMADFSADHRQARTHWENMARAMAAKRAGKLNASRG